MLENDCMEERLFEIGDIRESPLQGGGICIKNWGKNVGGREISRESSCKEQISSMQNSWSQGRVTSEIAGKVHLKIKYPSFSKHSVSYVS